MWNFRSQFMGVQIFQMSALEILYFVCFRKKCFFSYKKRFILSRGFFETNLDLRKHPQQVFWFFSTFFSWFFFQKNNPHILEELRQLCAKFHDLRKDPQVAKKWVQSLKNRNSQIFSLHFSNVDIWNIWTPIKWERKFQNPYW